MDKTAIKNFSIWARNKLIADITYKAGLLGITEEGIKDALPQSTQDAEFYDIGTKEPYAIHGEEIKQRKELVSAIRKKASQLEYKEAYRNVIEEVAYTWFNRLIAIRFMEVNDYMPAHIRVLSSEGGKKLEPDLVTTPFDAEIEFTQQETENILQMKNDNQVDALFRFLFIKQCNALNAYLPKLFEKTSDYTELLLNVSVTDQDGIVYHLTHDIKEDDFNISNIGEDGKPTGQVEIIGWLYQYYNIEPKNEAFAKKGKLLKSDIPAVTQLFTPDWIVRYMVENSIGRLWLEGHENTELKKGWKYYLDEAEQEADVEEQLKAIREDYKNIKPEEIKVIDPCMGSGHILVYAFDVLMQIYESYGYSQRDAAKSIVEYNIYGLDIDDRAFQLAYFAIMMKARSYNRRFLTLGIEPNLCTISESNSISLSYVKESSILQDDKQETLEYLVKKFDNAKVYGSAIEIEPRDFRGFLETWNNLSESVNENLIEFMWYKELDSIIPALAKQAIILSQKYEVVVTNPPYMGLGNAPELLNNFVKKNYPDSKTDMYSVFIERCGRLLAGNGYQAMITQHGWMFLSSFEKLRQLVSKMDIISMAHLGARAFEEIGGEVVQTVSFILRNSSIPKYRGEYLRLIEATSQKSKEELFLSGQQRYYIDKKSFATIPGQPIAYWLSNSMMEAFTHKKLSEYAEPRSGMSTTDNNRFLRSWYEVAFNKIGFGYCNISDTVDCMYKWYPYNKGGTYRKWYGNRELVVNWYNNGEEMKYWVTHNPRDPKTTSWSRRIFNTEYSFKAGITWSALANEISLRYCENGFMFDSKGASCFLDENVMYILAFLNSKVASCFLKVLCPTLDFNPGQVGKLPIIIDNRYLAEVENLANECIEIVKADWDSFENSWDFATHPFVAYAKSKNMDEVLLTDAYKSWCNICNERFERLKKNETRLNEIFIEIYGLNQELSSKIENKEISVREADLKRDVISFISYGIGCILGRYSCDENGLAYAGGDWNIDKYRTFIPDADNIIPITDEEYFSDDIVGLFCKWLGKTFGESKLEENLMFIANQLNVKGNTPREKLRYYFMNEFFKDHCTLYNALGTGKRPIYWLFDAGKQNGFKALIYMHRYNADTIGNLRVDYLHRMERIYESEINRMQDTIDNSGNAREVTAASKRKEKLQKQLKECQEYDEKIGHLALSRIEIDLDDGVKVNYEKVQTANDGKKYQVLAKI